jgi:HK97 gp10 family phage protein
MNVTFTDNSNEILSAAKNAKERALFRIGESVVTKWRGIIDEKHIIDTGRFKGSTDHYEEEDATIIGSKLKDPPYSIYLELGTSKMAARPSLKPAILDNKAQIKQIIEEEYKNG